MTDKQAKKIGLHAAWRKCEKAEFSELAKYPRIYDLVDLFDYVIDWFKFTYINLTDYYWTKLCRRFKRMKVA